MKIALLVHDYHRHGGHSRYVAELATRWASEHEVHVFANTFEADPGITFHRVPANRANALALILTFRRNASQMLRHHRFDIVHDQGLCATKPSVITAHIVNRAWSHARPNATGKEKLFGWVIGWLEKRQYGRAQVIAVSERVRRDLRSHYGVLDNVSVVYHGVDAEKFSPRARKETTNPTYLFVGDFRKGVETAIRALDAGTLVCVGSTPPEPYRQIAEQCGKADRVRFHPATDHIESFYNEADVLLLPTPYDAFGMVVLEALAAGLPVVASANAGASELIENGVNGFVFHNDSELPAVMRQASQSSVGEAARQTALRHSWDRVAAETMAVYRKAQTQPQIVAIATQGTGGNDEARLHTLLERHAFDAFPFSSQTKRQSAISLVRRLFRSRYPLAVMEGTGIAGGLPLLAAKLFNRQRYIVSSGDAIAPFVSQKQPMLAPFFALYERLLYRHSAGFIGWSPYLTGRALTFGAPRAMTAPGWPPSSFRSERGRTIRQQLGIPQDALVIGIAGSLTWTSRVQYCYGLELARAARLTKRTDLRFLIVGDGTGRTELNRYPDARIIQTGFVSRDSLPDYLAAMDMASLPQSCDGVGSFRFTTKLSEYLAAGLPVITGQIPAAYDLDEGWLWRLPGDAPWTGQYTTALAHLLETLTPNDVNAKRAAVPQAHPLFDRESQVRRVTAFLDDVLNAPCE